MRYLISFKFDEQRGISLEWESNFQIFLASGLHGHGSKFFYQMLISIRVTGAYVRTSEFNRVFIEIYMADSRNLVSNAQCSNT